MKDKTAGKESMLDNIIERTKKAMNIVNNNLYGLENINRPTQGVNSYKNPFASEGYDNNLDKEIDNTLDRINLLEYSHESRTERKITETMTEDDSSIDKINDLDLKNYDNFILKIEDLYIIDERLLKNNKNNPLYLECRVPLLKNENQVQNEVLNNQKYNLFYDTFKIFNKLPASDNIFKLNHVSYHKMNLTESNISTLMNSKIEIILHAIDMKNNNLDISLGRSEIDFNKIIMSKDFFFTKTIEITNFRNIKKKDEEKKNQPKSKNLKYIVFNKRQSKNIKEAKKPIIIENNIKTEVEVDYKIAEIQVSCQLYHSLGKDIGKKNKKLNREYYTVNEESPEEKIKNQVMENNNNDNNMIKEVEIDFEEILTLLINVQCLKPMNEKMNDNFFGKETNHYNFYLSHKIFPKAEVNKSEIVWSNKTPNFEYVFTMPFTMNQRVIGMLENYPFMVELWNRNFDQVDELMGTVKLEMIAILESLKISENLISIVPISKNLLPLIIYDDFYPVYNYDMNTNIAFLNISLGVGTSPQINNFLKRIQTSQKKQVEIEPQVKKQTQPQLKEQIKDDHFLNITNQNKNDMKKSSQRKQEVKELPDEEEDEIVKMLNNKKETENKQKIYNNNYLDLENYENLDKILETNKEYIKDRVYKDYKDSEVNFNKNFANSQFETKYISNNNYENPFINSIKKSNNFEIIEQKKTQLSIGNPNNFIINSVPKRTNELKISCNNNVQLLERKKELSDSDVIINSNLNQSKVNIHRDIIDETNIKIDPKAKNTENNTNHLNNLRSNDNQKFIFDLIIEKIINIPILKSIEKPFIRHKFFSDSEDVKSEILACDDSGVYEIDMKTSHSLVLPNIDKIKNYLSDITIFLYYNNRFEEEVVFGKAILPVDDLNDLIYENSSSQSEINRVIFIYGTEKINRDGSVIGKIRLQIKFNKNFVNQSNNDENLLLEKQLIYNRKIPKNANLSIYLNYFKYESAFLHLIDMKNNCYFLSLDPFGEDKNLKKNYPKYCSKTKFNSLNGLFDQKFSYNLRIEGQILDYLKTKNFLIYLNTKKSQNNIEDSYSSNDQEDGEDTTQIGICKVTMCEMLSLFDKICNKYPIFSINDNSVILGYINIELALENGNKETIPDEKATNVKNKKHKLTNAKSNFTDMLTNKKHEILDGKFYFNLKLFHLIYNDDFIKRLEKQFKINPQNAEKNLYFMYKIGKSIKKVSNVYDISLFIKNLDYFNILNIFHNEIMELSFYFSKNKPEDIVNQFIEGILEIKVFIKTEEDNIHIGSFMVDLSELFSPQCRLSNNLFTTSSIIRLYDNKIKKVDDSVRISLKITLMRSDLSSRDFKTFYNNLDSTINDSDRLQDILTNIYSPSSKFDHEKKKEILVDFFTEKSYNYIDLNILPIENTENDYFNIGIIINLFCNSTFYNNFPYILTEIVDSLSNENLNIIFVSFRLKKFLNNNMKLCYDSHNLLELFDNKSSVKVVLKEFIRIFHRLYVNSPLFDIYSKGIDEDDEKIDLVNFVYLIYVFKIMFGFQEDCKHNNPRGESNLGQSDQYYKLDRHTLDLKQRNINITVKSAMRLISDNKEKLNPYFIINWGDQIYHTSEIIVKTSYPAWNDSFKLPINESSEINLIKSNVPIQFILYSKNLNQLHSSSSMQNQDEYIGESKIYINDLLKMLTINNNEHEGFYHISSISNIIKGQFNIKFKFDSELTDLIRNKMSNIDPLASNTNLFLTKNFFEGDNKNENFSFKTSLKATNNDFLNCNFTSEDLWKNLNQNIDNINIFAKSIIIDNNQIRKNEDEKQKNNPSLYSTIERERRITDKAESDKRKNSLVNNQNDNSIMSLQMDFDNPYSELTGLNNSKKKINSLDDNLNSPVNKKPPIPKNPMKEKLLNMTIDPKELVRIRGIIKDKKSKKNTFYSSDESN